MVLILIMQNNQYNILSNIDRIGICGGNSTSDLPQSRYGRSATIITYDAKLTRRLWQNRSRLNRLQPA